MAESPVAQALLASLDLNAKERLIDDIFQRLQVAELDGEDVYSLAKLALQLSSRDPRVHRAVSDRVCRNIHACEPNSPRLRYAVVFCVSCPEFLAEFVLAGKLLLIHELSKLHDLESPSYIEITEESQALVASRPLASAILENQSEILNLEDILAFIRTLLRYTPLYREKMSSHWMPLLLKVVQIHTFEHAMMSKEILLALLRSSSPQPDQVDCTVFAEKLQPLCSVFWQNVEDLCYQPKLTESPHRMSIGLAIWLRVIFFSQLGWFSKDTLHDSDYWLRIQHVLAVGSTEQRKVAVAIFKRSVALCSSDIDLAVFRFRKSESDSYKSQYIRFIILFETIVLGRYINQVQDCMSDLEVFSHPQSLVRPTWMMTLLHASLSHGTQESVRKLIGMFVLNHGATVVSRSGQFGASFLETTFLPWATLGGNFPASVFREDGNPFGERLIGFLVDVIELAVTSCNEPLIPEGVIKFLSAKGGRIFSYGRAYILEGLVVGLRRSGHVFRCERDITSLVQVVEQGSFQEIVGNLMILQCHEIYENSVPQNLRLERFSNPISNARRLALSETQPKSQLKITGRMVHISQSSTGSSGAPQPDFSLPYDETLQTKHPVSRVATWIQDSRHRCLSGEGLAAVYTRIYDTFEDDSQYSINSTDLNLVWNAIWNELDVRGHPRHLMLHIPKVLLHPKCVHFAAQDDELKKTLSKISDTLWLMAQTKIYMFYPLAAALRRIFLNQTNDPIISCEFFFSYAMSPPSAKAEFNMERTMALKLKEYVPERSYEYYYGKTEEMGHACVFDTLNKLPNNASWDTICRAILVKLIARWRRQVHPVPIFSHWKTTAQLQVMLLLLKRLGPKLPIAEIDDYVSSLLEILAIEPLPRLRFLLEWTILQLDVDNSGLRRRIIDSLSNEDISNPKLTVSMIRIALMISRLPSAEEQFGLQAMIELIPLSASQKVVIRYEALRTIPLLWDQATLKGWRSVTDNVAFMRLNSHIRNLEAFRKPPATRDLESLDPLIDQNLVNLLEGNYLSIDPSEAAKCSRQDLISVQDESDLSSNELLPLGNVKAAYKPELYRKPNEARIPALTESSASLLQTKSATWHDEGVYAGEERESYEIIVVASLIDNPYNLGGICRVSEIFGVRKLHMRRLDVIKSKDFTSVSVASHQWLPMEELQVKEMVNFIALRKAEGYQVVGMEQTDGGLLLGTEECKLPSKMVLVLGSEREGIPAELLAEMDFCIEVRQTGITRSMNVQTALSVGLYEYQCQRRSRSG